MVALSMSGTAVTISLGPWLLTAAAVVVGLVVSLGFQQQRELQRNTRPIGMAEFEAAGLGPPAGPSGSTLYLDLLKRALINVLYYESSQPLWVYGPEHKFRLCDGFELENRVVGEDMPGNAMTMVGWKRLSNVQQCVESVLDGGVRGDLVETGACKGGTCIFMRGVLKALGSTDRKVYVCDTFHPPDPPPQFALRILLGIILYVVASVPNRSWKRSLCKTLQKLDPNFPTIEDPSDEMVDLAISIVKSIMFLPYAARVEKSLDCVQSNFARFGLLDDQVVFLKGWFSDTLPDAGIDNIAVLRLDGDTYESTMDALEHLYAKVSDGGYCIIDDYWSFDDCKRAVDEYRANHGIRSELVRIDGLSCYWKVSCQAKGK